MFDLNITIFRSGMVCGDTAPSIGMEAANTIVLTLP